jgi:hypothetical protein
VKRLPEPIAKSKPIALNSRPQRPKDQADQRNARQDYQNYMIFKRLPIL